MMQVEYIAHSGDDLLVVNAARVSFAKRSDKLSDEDKKLIHYLAKHKHWTPFAHPQVTLHIKAPVFVRTQCFKHKVGFVENEVSRRYVDDAPEFFHPGVWRQRPEVGIKQGSGKPMDEQNSLFSKTMELYERSLKEYEAMIESGVAPEQARMVLPQGVMTEWFWTGSLAAWARFYAQRTDPHAQRETSDLAKQCGSIISPLYPESWKALTPFHI